MGVLVGGWGVAVRVLRRVGVGGTGVLVGITGVSVKVGRAGVSVKVGGTEVLVAVGGNGVFVTRGRVVGVEVGGATCCPVCPVRPKDI